MMSEVVILNVRFDPKKAAAPKAIAKAFGNNDYYNELF
jgi:hypothetical protein